MFKFPIKKIIQILLRGVNRGECPVCEKRTLFVKIGAWLRDHYLCVRCRSIPRQRALIHTLDVYIPDWRNMRIHESSPSEGSIFNKFLAECQDYTASQFYPEIPRGTVYKEFRCEDLANQTFADESFDLVITQDVFEHLLDPIQSLQEICRTLKPGGVHVFTVPWYFGQKTKIRAKQVQGTIEHLAPANYHANPISEKGSLVVTDWGSDFIDIIYAACGMTTTVMRIFDKRLGIEGKFIEVFISKKSVMPVDLLLKHWD